MNASASYPWNVNRAFPLMGILAGLILAALSLQWMYFDDTYIHIRIARHLLEHGSPQFNLGDHFKADSSTGYLLILSAISAIAPIEVGIRAIQALAIIAACAALATLVAQHNGARRIKALLVAAAAMPTFLLCAFGGMESSIACALAAWAVVLLLTSGNAGPAVCLISFAACIRIEMALLLALLLLHLVRHRKQSWTLVFWTFPFAAICLLDWHWFGSILPHAAKVKSAAYGMPLKNSFGGAMSAVRGKFTTAALLVTGCLAIYAMLRRRFSPTLQEALLLFSVALFGAWALSRSIIFEWYLCLLSFPLALALLTPDGESPKPRYWLGFLALAGTCAVGWKLLMYFGPLNQEGHLNMRVPRYIRVGAGLYEACPSCTLASSEIGGLGEGFKGRIYDAFGLGDPAAVPFHPMKVPQERQRYDIGAIPPGYIALRKPDLVVTLDVYSQALQRSAVAKSYIRYDCPFPPETLIYARNSAVIVYAKQPLSPHTQQRTGCLPV